MASSGFWEAKTVEDHADSLGLHPCSSRNAFYRMSNGNLIAFPGAGSAWRLLVSQDDGTTWTAAATSLPFAMDTIGDFHAATIDASDRIYLWHGDWSSQRLRLYVGTPNVGRTDWTWTGIVATLTKQNNDIAWADCRAFSYGGDDYLITAKLEASSSGASAYVHAVRWEGGYGGPMTTILNGTTAWTSYSTALEGEVYIALRDLDDPLSVNVKPDFTLWAAFTGIPDRYHTLRYEFNTSTKTWTANPILPSTEPTIGLAFSTAVEFDLSDSRWMVARSSALSERADDYSTGWGLASPTVTTYGFFIDPATGDILQWNINSGTDIVAGWYDHSTDTWPSSLPTVATLPGSNVYNVSSTNARSVVFQRISATGEFLGYVSATDGAGTARVWLIRYFANNPPSAPTWVSPADGSSADVGQPLTLDWQFNDLDAGDTQSAYTLRRRLGSGSYEFWNGTGWQASEDATTKIVDNTTEITLAAGWGADTDPDHYYSVKTWDAADAGPSPWSVELRIVPSAKINPTITDPTSGATVGATHTVQWTVGDQSKYRVVVSDTSSSTNMDAGTLEYDSGEVISSGDRSHTVSFPTNAVTRYVRLQTWNSEGLASDIAEVDVVVSYTPVAAATVTVTPDDVNDTITVTVDNPAPGVGEPNPVSNDIYRREVGQSGNGIRIATGVAVDGSTVDHFPRSGVEYEYRALTLGDNGTTTFSAWSS